MTRQKFIFSLLLITALFSFSYATPDTTESMVIKYREMGPPGLQKALEKFRPEIDKFKATGEKTDSWLITSAILDRIAKQKDSYASELFWYTELGDALAESKKSGKPILSLRLLGNLDEELSCANSRFFRSALYPNANISKYLRENYILHWQSVRPAPRVTIDFGDGRKMETTLTGNSIHYILNSDGQVMDAIPGLYAPVKFFALLESGKRMHDGYVSSGDKKGKASFYNFSLSGAIESIERGWRGDLMQLRIDKQEAEPSRILPAGNDSLTAGRAAVSKSVVEFKILPVAVIHERVKLLEKDTDAAKWKDIASLHREQSGLDENSKAFIGRKLNIKGPELDKLVKQFEDNVALDTVRNEYLFHSKIYLWLSQGLGGNGGQLNEKIYSELFLTPSSDPWLGLYAPEIYNGIENAGISN
jgi:hypothetical protein